MKILLLTLVCLSTTVSGFSCKTDSDCLSMNTCKSDVCKHKNLDPPEPVEYGAFVLFLAVSAIGNSVGNGGSAALLGLLVIMLHFDTQKIVGLSVVFLTGGAIIVVGIIFNKKHPTRNRPAIYYDAIMILICPILIGIRIGNILQQTFPTWLKLALLALIILYLIYDSFKNFLRLYSKDKMNAQNQGKTENTINSGANVPEPRESEENEKENKRKKKRKKRKYEEEKKDEEKNQLASENLESENNTEQPFKKDRKKNKIDPELQKKLDKILKGEQKPIEWIHLIFFILLLGFCIGFSLIQGSSANPSLVGVKLCSDAYFSLNVVYFVFMIVMDIIASAYLIRKTQICESAGYDFDEGDPRWNKKYCAIVSISSVIIGIPVTLIGLGVGNFIVSVLIAIGARPEVATASSSFMVFLSSFITSVQYLVGKSLLLDYSGVLIAISFVGSSIGILGIRRYAVKKKKTSMLILVQCLFFVFALSVTLASGISVSLYESSKGNFKVGFNSFC